MAAAASRLGARLAQQVVRSPVASSSRLLHTSSARCEISKFAMPAMSPTMTEGGLAAWKVKEGDSFSAGDVLLEIETDKATMDVEAQEDGIMAKIIVEAGEKGVPVGKAIAMLAEEGDDISDVQVPKEEEQAAAPKSDKTSKEESQSSKTEQTSSTPTKTAEKGNAPNPQPAEASKMSGSHHAPDLGRTLFPSVARLLIENNVSKQDAQKIKASGIRGMLTKGDVLSFLGQASSPSGSYKEGPQGVAAQGGVASAGTKKGGAQKVDEPLTSEAVRSMIFAGLASASSSSRAKAAASRSPSPQVASADNLATGRRRSAFDELLDDYSFSSAKKPSDVKSSTKKGDAFAGLL